MKFTFFQKRYRRKTTPRHDRRKKYKQKEDTDSDDDLVASTSTESHSEEEELVQLAIPSYK